MYSWMTDFVLLARTWAFGKQRDAPDIVFELRFRLQEDHHVLQGHLSLDELDKLGTIAREPKTAIGLSKAYVRQAQRTADLLLSVIPRAMARIDRWTTMIESGQDPFGQNSPLREHNRPLAIAWHDSGKIFCQSCAQATCSWAEAARATLRHTKVYDEVAGHTLFGSTPSMARAFIKNPDPQMLLAEFDKHKAHVSRASRSSPQNMLARMQTLAAEHRARFKAMQDEALVEEAMAKQIEAGLQFYLSAQGK